MIHSTSQLKLNKKKKKTQNKTWFWKANLKNKSFLTYILNKLSIRTARYTARLFHFQPQSVIMSHTGVCHGPLCAHSLSSCSPAYFSHVTVKQEHGQSVTLRNNGPGSSLKSVGGRLAH